MKLYTHASSLATSTAISECYVKNIIPPLAVITILNKERIPFMLLGAHGYGGWMQKPRATEDVDILVGARYHKKAVRVLIQAFPQLEAEEHHVVMRLLDRTTRIVLIDVMQPNQQLFREALKHAHWVTSEGQRYRIPSLEMALTMKFAPMVSLHRKDKDKFQDAHDFMYIVDSNPDIDLEKLAELGDLVYPGGGKEIVEKVRQVRAGERLQL